VPILHLQFTAETQAPDGKKVQIPPALALHQRGPVIQVSVTIEQNAGKALLAQGKALPTPKTGFALIDTGASNTCIDDQAAVELGLPIIDVAHMQSASHSKHQCNVYPVTIDIPGIVNLNSPRTLGAALAGQGLLALIGRDVLAYCTLFYNGPLGQITLSR
jgi:predicted aspartyl protease